MVHHSFTDSTSNVTRVWWPKGFTLVARPHIAVILLQLIETYRREPRLEGPSFVICSSGMPSDRSGLLLLLLDCYPRIVIHPRICILGVLYILGF